MIDCQSPVVEKWAQGKGELVTEVGFFGKERRYFLRPKIQQDLFDEKSAFRVLPYIIATDETKAILLINRVSSFLNIVMEPDFGNEYYREIRNYMLQGTDFKLLCQSLFHTGSGHF